MLFKAVLRASVTFGAVLSAHPASAQAIPAAPTDPVATTAAAPAAPGTDTAQDPAAAAAEDGLIEIIVTAQRRAENLQTVPIAATALSPTALAEKAVRLPSART